MVDEETVLRPVDVARLAEHTSDVYGLPSGTIMFAAMPKGRGTMAYGVVLRELTAPGEDQFAPHGKFVVHYWNVEREGDTYQGDYATDYAEAVAIFLRRVARGSNALDALRAEMERR
jgi:hypothetical protein